MRHTAEESSSSAQLRGFVPALVFTTTFVGIISSLGAPLLPTISQDMQIPISTAQWSLTITVLVGAVCTPVMGRLGDGRRRRETLVAGLAAVTLGCVIAALAPNFATLILGRALQGIGLGIVPLTMAAARDHLPRERAHRAIALLSVCVAAGAGIGYPIGGLLVQLFGMPAAFWFGATASGIALIWVAFALPRGSGRMSAGLDVSGALLMAVGLVALLLGIGEGNAWGWSSPIVLGLLAAGVLILAGWAVHQLHSKAPLVDLRQLRHPAVRAADGCALVLGVALYIYVTVVAEFVQAPAANGYGFSATIAISGLTLVPMSITSFGVSRALPWLTRHLGERALLPLGSLAIGVSGAFFALAHASLWQAFLMMAILGVGVGLTSAVIPGMIVRAVPLQETGSALGFYQVVRYIGFSLGSAMAGMILGAHTPPNQHLPTVDGYQVSLWVVTGICVAAAAIAWWLPSDSGGHADDQLAVENAELGPTGLIGLPDEV